MEVGQHCSFSACKRLDFLPFTCDCCGRLFCKDHRAPDDHACQNTGSRPELQGLPPAPGQGGRGSYQCSVDGCRRRELMEVNCPHCDKNFCLAHRHQEDHGCEAIQGGAAPSSLRRQHYPKDKSPSGETRPPATAAKKVLRGARSESTSIKVALMKMKMKAVGPSSVPESERVYYEVELPEEYRLPKKPMFFSKEWSVGKAVDVIAETFRLRNENHRQHSQKLLLYSMSGESLAMSKPLHSLLDVLPSGSGTRLEYEIPTNE